MLAATTFFFMIRVCFQYLTVLWFHIATPQLGINIRVEFCRWLMKVMRKMRMVLIVEMAHTAGAVDKFEQMNLRKQELVEVIV